MTKRSRQYFERKAIQKWEQGMLDCFYCVECQALNEYECMCDFLEEQNEIYEQMMGDNDPDELNF